MVPCELLLVHFILFLPNFNFETLLYIRMLSEKPQVTLAILSRYGGISFLFWLFLFKQVHRTGSTKTELSLNGIVFPIFLSFFLPQHDTNIIFLCFFLSFMSSSAKYGTHSQTWGIGKLLKLIYESPQNYY